jgi:hypothetical protein
MRRGRDVDQAGDRGAHLDGVIARFWKGRGFSCATASDGGCSVCSRSNAQPDRHALVEAAEEASHTASSGCPARMTPASARRFRDWSESISRAAALSPEFIMNHGRLTFPAGRVSGDSTPTSDLCGKPHRRFQPTENRLSLTSDSRILKFGAELCKNASKASFHLTAAGHKLALLVLLQLVGGT